ncbi:ABC transporter transmembrane domain-containing protein [Neptuniibacter halophilus]|uniref:ABC transporter transmembrane domain-containing protein n=1 Tax=Neptuniibacter halophilus TaxID=651666 RepID=UPI002573492E|nr:ABC transporter transmembrane domain-containing protein [Neptuniibacter halophilus]
MEPRIFRYILKHSLKDQIQVVFITLLSFPVLYATLELPKLIINDALNTDKKTVQILEMNLTTEQLLLSYCAIYLLLIITSGLFKMRINTLKGIIGERLVRRLRYELTDRILRFPPKQFQRVSQGELISTITAEAEPLGGYIGDSLALPLLQGGTMLTILIFMFMQSPVLGIASIMLIPLQLLIIPRLQRHINNLKKERVKVVRHFSERIGEAVDGAVDIRLNGTELYHQAEFSSILGRLFLIRLDIFKRKFFMKFINNFINSLTPIMFYSIGGILAIRGEVSVGALVAAIAAHKDLTTPWRELLNFYQIYQDAKIRYAQIIDRFHIDELGPEISDELISFDHNQRLDGDITFNRVWLSNDAGERFLYLPDLRIRKGGTVSVQAVTSAQNRAIAFALCHLQPASSGQITLSGTDINQLPRTLVHARIGYAGPDPFLFNENVAQNINYGLRLVPPTPEENEARLLELEESRASGNSEHPFAGSWSDLSVVGYQSWPEMRPWFESCIYALGSGNTLYHLGLQEKFNPATMPEDFSPQFLAVRRRVHEELLPKTGYEQFYGFHRHQFCPALMMIENLTFAVVSDVEQTLPVLAAHPKMREFLAETELLSIALEGGQMLARDIYRELVGLDSYEALPDNLTRFDTPRIREALMCHYRPGIEQTEAECDEALVLELFLRSCFASTIATLINEEHQKQIVKARGLIAGSYWQDLRELLQPLDYEQINPNLNLLQNILFGVLVDAESERHKWLQERIEQIMIEEEARSLVLIVFSMSAVGIRGARLPLAARQRVQLARGLIKKPDILILHDALSAIEEPEQEAILKNIRRLLPNCTLIHMSTHHLDWHEFDQRFLIRKDRMEELLPELEETAS